MFSRIGNPIQSKQSQSLRRYLAMFQRISKIVIVSIILIAFGSVLQATADTEANKSIALRLVDLWNTGNLAIADEIFAADFVNHDPSNPNVIDLKSYKGWVVEVRTAWPDFHVEDHDMVAEGDKVAARWTSTGTQKGEFIGIPPTGKKGMTTGMHIYRFADGKIVEHWWTWDVLGMLQQLGAIPPMGPLDFAWGEPSKVTGAPGDPEANKAIFSRVADEIWNQGKLEIVDELIATDYVYHNPANSIRGTEGYKLLVTMMRSAFPDFRFNTIEDKDMIAEGDKVAGRWIATGTHKGEYMGIPPTGKKVTVEGIMISRFADGKVVEDWESVDSLGLLQQLGVIPSMKPEDFSNVFFMPLAKGLNMISLPLKPTTPYTARLFAKEIGSTVVIRYNETSGKFEGFAMNAPGDGFSIEGGKGYIVNVTKDGVVAFTGAAWTNQPPVQSAPIAQTTSAWAFVVSGLALDGETMSARNGGYNVIVRNLRTGIATTETVDGSGYFATAYADLNRKAVIEAGDGVEVSVVDNNGNMVSVPFIHKVTLDEIRNAVVNIQLRLGDIIPAKSVLFQNFPNPFNPETWIPYQLKEDSEVNIRIYNTSGQLIRTLNLGHKSAGLYTNQDRSAYWDGKNDTGEHVSSGVYFYNIQAGEYTATMKMTITK